MQPPSHWSQQSLVCSPRLPPSCNQCHYKCILWGRRDIWKVTLEKSWTSTASFSSVTTVPSLFVRVSSISTQDGSLSNLFSWMTDLMSLSKIQFFLSNYWIDIPPSAQISNCLWSIPSVSNFTGKSKLCKHCFLCHQILYFHDIMSHVDIYENRWRQQEVSVKFNEFKLVHETKTFIFWSYGWPF